MLMGRMLTVGRAGRTTAAPAFVARLSTQVGRGHDTRSAISRHRDVERAMREPAASPASENAFFYEKNRAALDALKRSVPGARGPTYSVRAPRARFLRPCDVWPRSRLRPRGK